MQWSADIGGLFNIINPFNWLNYSNQKENQAYQRQQDHLNRQMQYDFAQNSIKWRTEDAKQSGIHPLAALGVSPSAASPVYSSSESPRADFGDMFKAQVNLVKAQTEKAEAEAKAISGQSGISADVSAPGTPSVQKKSNDTMIKAQGIETPADAKEVLKESRQDRSTVAIYDHLQNIDDGSLTESQKFDAIKSFFSGMANYDSYPVLNRFWDMLVADFKNFKPVKGYNNIGDFNRAVLDIWTKNNGYSFSERVSRTRQLLKIWSEVIK